MGFKPFLEGGIAAIIAGALTHPLDLIKVRMQLQGEHSFPHDQNPNPILNLDHNLPVKPYQPVFALDSLIGSISLLPNSSIHARSSFTRSVTTPFAVGAHIVKNEGPSALFSGVSATVLRQMLYSATRMGIYDFLKRRWTDRLTGNFPLVTKITAGLIAGAIGSAVGNPADVAMVRMQADGGLPLNRRRNYKSVVDALERIVRQEGVSSLWRGSWLTVNRAMIVTASQLATYDHVKEILIAGGRGTPGGIGTHVAASFAAGIVAAVASNPIDVVKTRMMNADKENYGGPLDCALKTVAEEGPMALYKGFVPTVTRQGPFTMILFITLEQIRGVLKDVKF
ncbi:PREDICTED: mitochondrial uncoupling protein 6 [Camelina sativa]|uniref:Mitochondrial uncoupling protein 6 n=1 Tax=Camelina sativa TaxID=90675 RepID=A0ABM0V9G5_CAMSA|nr:PREDICTED: mitochondrial uncoupling protein 6 [Camelina sativa]